MSKNKDEDYYEDREEKRLSVIKRIGITLLIILAIIILFFMLKGCDRFNNNNNSNIPDKSLLEAGKEYYEYNDYLLPKSIGDCKTVTLNTLMVEGLLAKTKYPECSVTETYVKVCKLESGKYQFVAFKSCPDELTEETYGDWKEGTESEIVSDVTDVKFLFQAQYLNSDDSELGKEEELWEDEIKYTNYKTISTTKYYRYKDLQYLWNIIVERYYPGDKAKSADVKEYYIASPASGYIYKNSENKNVSKYYSSTGEKEYWVNSEGKKGFATSAPDSTYVYKDNPVSQTRYQTRTWTEVSKPTQAPPTQVWYCASPNDTLQHVSFVACENNENNPEFTITVRTFYSCDNGLTEVGKNGTCYRCSSGKLKTDRTSCGSYSDWSDFTTTQCDTTSDLCQSTTLVIYNWYKLNNEVRKYYPSNASASSGEKAYYAQAPVEGLIKDTDTTTTGWKWYKKVSSQTTDYYTVAPQAGATKTGTSKWTAFTNWSTSKPASLGTTGTRVVETKNKLKIKEILGQKSEWLEFNKEYLELDTLLNELQNKGYKVYSLDDINLSGELKYKVKLYIRNKEEDNG